MNTYIVSTVLVKNLGTGQTNIANSISEVEAMSEDEAKGKALTQVSKDLPEHQINTMLAVLINANPWQQAIDDELVNAHLGVAKDEITREEAKAELNKLIAWYIDVAKYFDSQAQQTESKPALKVVNGEICYLSTDDDQSYGMWCPVSYDTKHGYREGTKFITIPPAPEYQDTCTDGGKCGIGGYCESCTKEPTKDEL